MNDALSRKQGRPSPEVTKDRVNQILSMLYRGGCSLGMIMQTFNVSQTGAWALRKKALKMLKNAQTKDSEVTKDKYFALCRLEYLERQIWKEFDAIGRKYPEFTLVPHADKMRIKLLNTLLNCQHFRAEMNGFVQTGSRNQLNFYSVEQKLIMNALNLSPEDFTDKNIRQTLLRLAETYKNGKDATGEANEKNEADTIFTPN